MESSRHLAILFADITASTRLYETKGDTIARKITSKCIQLLSQVTLKYQGRVIKTIGDEVMCVFPDAEKAATAAMKMHEIVDENQHVFGYPLTIQVGFHYGQVIEEEGDVFGDAVNLAARMAGQAKASQTVLSKETLLTLSPMSQQNARLLTRTIIKGKQDPIDIYELTWGETEDLTIVAHKSQMEPLKKFKHFIEVSNGDKTIKLNEISEKISFGRGVQNDIQVEQTKASRIHATIEIRGEKFIFTDKSTNGSYVLMDNKQYFIRHDEVLLKKSGVISLGQKINNPEQPFLIHFKVHSFDPSRSWF